MPVLLLYMYASLKNTQHHPLSDAAFDPLAVTFMAKKRVESGWDLYPLQRMISQKKFFFFLLAQLASLSSASSFYSTSFLFFSFFFSSFACHIFKEASPCQNCQLLLHKLCPSQIWQKIEKDSRFWNVMHQCIIRLNSWHTNMIDRYVSRMFE